MILNSHSIEAYVLALGLKSINSLNEICERLEKDHFSLSLHKKIFTCMQDLYLKNVPVSIHTVQNKGVELGIFNDMAYLMEITFDDHHTSALSEYIAKLLEFRKNRLYVDMIQSAAQKLDEAESADVAGTKLQDELDKIFEAVNEDSIKTVKEGLSLPYKGTSLPFLDYVRKKIDDNANGIQTLSGLSTGYDSLDHVTDGLQPAWVYVIGARPSEGKSQFLINVMNNVAKNKHPVLFFSLEMPSEDVISILLSINGEYDNKKMKEGHCNPLDYQKLIYASDFVKNLPIHIDDQPSLNTAQIRSRVKRMIKSHGIKAVFIDYLQEVKAPGKYPNLQEEKQAMSRDIREMAKEFKIPFFCAAQVNRDSEKGETPKPPTSAQLRESGQLEQCAWFIGMLHRPDRHDPYDQPGQLHLYIRKNRFGERPLLKFNHSPTPCYSYKIIEIKELKNEQVKVLNTHNGRKDVGDDFERFTKA